jgi:hypothetical protein
MKLTIHLTDRVRLRLRPEGEELLRRIYASRPEHLKADLKGYITLPLFEVMFLFGRTMGVPPHDLEIDATLELICD